MIRLRLLPRCYQPTPSHAIYGEHGSVSPLGVLEA